MVGEFQCRMRVAKTSEGAARFFFPSPYVCAKSGWRTRLVQKHTPLYSRVGQFWVLRKYMLFVVPRVGTSLISFFSESLVVLRDKERMSESLKKQVIH